MKALFLFLLLIAPAVAQGASRPEIESALAVEQDAEPIATTTVGMRVRIDELRIRGSQLRAKPVADPGRADVIVRVINVFPHGNDFRYNLEIMPLVEGTIDLRDHLERLDETALTGLQPLLIDVAAVLPVETLLPNELAAHEPADVGGYRTKLIVLGVLWGIGLLALLFVGRKRRDADADGEGTKPLTLADRLQPLVEGARAGDLSTGQRAELERLLLAHWRDRRDLAGVHVAESVSRLRRDEEAGPLFLQLEEWLHSPAGGADPSVDISDLLEPYRRAPDVVKAGGAP